MLRIQAFCLLALTAFFNVGYSITLLQVIHSYPELSTLNTYISNSTNATNFLSNANNFTFLAPNNAAIGSFISQNPKILTEDLLEATLQYSLLQGGHPKLSFSNTPQFVASGLNNASYANVTGGQRVELVLDGSGTPQAVTGNKSTSDAVTTDIICQSGLIHIMSSVVSVPIQAVSEFSAAGLSYFTSILTQGNYLNMQNAYVQAVLDLPDITYFIPNSAAALANATALAANSSTQELQSMFEYHIVPGFVGYSTDFKDGMGLKTAQGSNVTITLQGGDMFVNSARVIERDFVVANGVVHVIDNLLNFNNTSPPPKPTSSTAGPTSTPAPTATPTSSPTSAPSSDSALSKSASSSLTKSLSTGATIGIAVGSSIAGISLIALLAFLLLRLHRSHQNQRDQDRNSGSWSSEAEKRQGLRPIRTDIGGEPYSAGTQHDGYAGSGGGGGFVSQEPMDGRDTPVPIPLPLRSPRRLETGNEFF